MRINKFLIVLPLTLLLLFSFSFASPNVYALNNFYSGSGMCFGPSLLSSGSYDESTWTWFVSPTTPRGNEDKYKDVCVVSSFSDIIMSGTTDVTSVPLVDFDRNIGKQLVLPAGNCVVIYSRSFNSYISSSAIRYSVLGFHKPISSNTTTRRTTASVTSAGVGTITLNNAATIFSTFEAGQYIFLYNQTSNEVTIQVEDYTSTGYVDVTTTPINNVHWIINTATIGSTTTTYAIPHIKGVADIYVNVAANAQIASDTNCSLRTSYGNTFTSISGGTLKVTWQTSLLMDCTCRFANYGVEVAYPSSSGSATYETTYTYDSYNGCPTFLNNTIYLFPYSVNLNNTRELAKAIADALASQGGSGDYNTILGQILNELQLSNSGGPLGNTVRQGMEALEQQHQTIIDNADFDGFSSIFDDYSYLYDFSQDLHWLITANNALFSYFVGFILLCAGLITASRLMR